MLVCVVISPLWLVEQRIILNKSKDHLVSKVFLVRTKTSRVRRFYTIIKKPLGQNMTVIFLVVAGTLYFAKGLRS